VNCIKGEIHNIIASLRLGWAAQIAFLSDFKALHEQLCEVLANRRPSVPASFAVRQLCRRARAKL
jgi:hypothetical protein